MQISTCHIVDEKGVPQNLNRHSRHFYFIFRVFSCHFGFAADWENWNENARMSFPSFSPSHWLGKLFNSPQLSTVFLIQDGSLNN